MRGRDHGIVSAASDDGPMTTTMTNYALLWTDPNGTPRSSAVAYDKTSANRRKTELEGAGCTEVIVETKPGTLPEPRG